MAVVTVLFSPSLCIKVSKQKVGCIIIGRHSKLTVCLCSLPQYALHIKALRMFVKYTHYNNSLDVSMLCREEGELCQKRGR